MKKLPDSFKKSKVIIYETTDYDQFEIPSYQRDVTDTRKKRTLASYKEYTSFSIGVCDENFKLINGRGRLEISRILGIAFPFVIIKGAGVKDFISLNRSVVTLPLSHYESIYSGEGIKDYQTFESFRIKYSFGINVALNVAIGKRTIGGSKTDIFRAGQFKFEDYKEACKLADHILSFEMQFGSICKSTSFVNAVKDLYQRETYDMQRMEKKTDKYGHLYPIKAGGVVYVRGQLQNLYNHHTKFGFRI